MKTKRLAQLVCASLIAAALPAIGAEWPSGPVKVVVGFPAGTSTDLIARIYADGLREQLKQPFVIENKPGAAGAIAAAGVAAANADGQTLYVATIANAIGHTVYAPVYKSLKTDVIKSFAPVSIMAATPTVLVVSSKIEAKSVEQLITYAKAHPGEVFYASGGAGTAPHLVAELFNQKAGVELTHVPYKSLGEAVTDLITGRVSVMFAPLPAVAPFFEGGKIRPLAIASEARSNLASSVPTLQEAGVPGVVAEVWYGVFAPKDTPRDVVEKISAAINHTSKDSSGASRLAAAGAVPRSSTPEDAARFVSSEVDRWKTVVEGANIKVD